MRQDQFEALQARGELTAIRLRELLDYNPATGVFTNKSPRKKITVGEIAGAIDKSNGYWKITIDRRHYFAHRLAFLFMTGAWPSAFVDHINGDRTANHWENLRDVPKRINQQNRRTATAGSKSGLLGAHKKRGRWSSQIHSNGQLIKLGVFTTAEQAHTAYVTAKRKLHEGCTI